MNSEISPKKPWVALSDFIEEGNGTEVQKYVANLSSEELASLISHLSSENRKLLLTLLNPEDAVGLIEEIPYVQAVQMMDKLDASEAAAIINEMQSDDQADFLSEFESDDAEAILREMLPEQSEKARKLIVYDQNTAGGIMITEFLAFEETNTVKQVADHLRENAEKYEKYNVQYIYVTSDNRFIGVLRIRDLVLTRPEVSLSEIVIRNALTVNDTDSIEDLISFFNTNDFYGVPVMKDENELVGIVLRKHVLAEEAEMANIELLETQGIVGGEELRTMPILLRSRRRLSWLSINILLNILAASVIAFYQDTLSSVIALAVFLPIISDMSGCSGNQAVAVSLRELSLGVVKPFEMVRVLFQEFWVGLINGFILGILIGMAAWLWQGNVYLGMVVGGALMINTIVAVSIGGTIPLILKRLNQDPALASGPILTTITDMLGFFLALTFASASMAYIS